MFGTNINIQNPNILDDTVITITIGCLFLFFRQITGVFKSAI